MKFIKILLTISLVACLNMQSAEKTIFIGGEAPPRILTDEEHELDNEKNALLHAIESTKDRIAYNESERRETLKELHALKNSQEGISSEKISNYIANASELENAIIQDRIKLAKYKQELQKLNDSQKKKHGKK